MARGSAPVVRQLTNEATVPNLLLRSRRKLDEAAFFLDRIRESQGKDPDFPYYFSAFLSAIRSVGFVLQSDLRPRFGERFDAWWKTAKEALPKPRIPFQLITELRNQALKEGELLPGMVVVAKVKHPAIDVVCYTVDVSKGRVVVVSEEYKFRSDWGYKIQVPTGTPHEVLRQKVWDEFIPAFVDLHRALNETEPDFTISSLDYLLEPGGSAVSFEEMVTGLAEHVESMRETLRNASREFETDAQK